MADNTTETSKSRLSSDPLIDELLHDFIGQLKEYTETQTRNLSELTRIGIALSATRNLDQLLEMIVDRARQFTNADGGTLYLVNEDESALDFTIVQTESLGFRMGGITGGPITLPSVPLRHGDEPNDANVCAYVANSGELVNIPDVYQVEGFNFEGTRVFDQRNNYRSKSMLVIPMRDHQDDIIGVLQLINARDSKTGATIPFPERYQELTAALASQAAIAITNARLISELQNLFDSFIKTIAAAIDEKSHYTGGHIERVAELTMEIAHHINAAQSGPFAEVRFTEDEMQELRLAAWLHDTGKITTPEYVVDKRTKLETIFDRRELVRLRIELAIANARRKAAEVRAVTMPLEAGMDDEGTKSAAEVEAKCRQLQDDLKFILESNTTSEFVPDENIERLEKIAARRVETSLGPEPLLTDDELQNLKVRKGNLTDEERRIINNHAAMTIKLLEQLPFPKRMRNVPLYAGAHHEKLNGTGYPNGLKGDEIPLQARIMALADIFEALTARDRPYKKPMMLSQAVKILGFMVKDGELDGDLVDFFLDRKLHLTYARKYMDPEKIDME